MEPSVTKRSLVLLQAITLYCSAAGRAISTLAFFPRGSVCPSSFSQGTSGSWATAWSSHALCHHTVTPVTSWVGLNACVCTQTHTHTCTHAHTHTHGHTVYTLTQERTYVCTHTHTCTHTCARTRTHTSEDLHTHREKMSKYLTDRQLIAEH